MPNNAAPALPATSWPSPFCAFSAAPSPIAIWPSAFTAGPRTVSRKRNSPPSVPSVTFAVCTRCAAPFTVTASCFFVGSWSSATVVSRFARAPTTSGCPLPANRLIVPSDCGRALPPSAPATCWTSASRWSSRSFGIWLLDGSRPSVRMLRFSVAICAASELTFATVSSICRSMSPAWACRRPPRSLTRVARVRAVDSSVCRDAASAGLFATVWTAAKKVSEADERFDDGSVR